MPIQSFHVPNVLCSTWSSAGTKKFIRLTYLAFSTCCRTLRTWSGALFAAVSSWALSEYGQCWFSSFSFFFFLNQHFAKNTPKMLLLQKAGGADSPDTCLKKLWWMYKKVPSSCGTNHCEKDSSPSWFCCLHPYSPQVRGEPFGYGSCLMPWYIFRGGGG